MKNGLPRETIETAPALLASMPENSSDPDLEQLRNVWPTLPAYLKLAILALARTECG